MAFFVAYGIECGCGCQKPLRDANGQLALFRNEDDARFQADAIGKRVALYTCELVPEAKN